MKQKIEISESALKAIEGHFHDLIRKRVGELIDEPGVELPRLTVPRDPVTETAWFAVPGFHGGFSYWFESKSGQVRLITESWSRIVGGSGQRHVITETGSRMTDQGFV